MLRSRSSPLHNNMQVQNASSNGGGFVPLSANVTWVSPLLPGEPPGILSVEFAACVPSNVDLASTCCSAVNGQFIQQDLANFTILDDAEMRQIYENKYPGMNLSVPTSGRKGDLINATGPGEAGAINWCHMPFNPLSDTPIVGSTWTSGGGLAGNVPQSIMDWIKCFDNSTSAEARSRNEAVYLCTVRDVMSGGQIAGWNTTYASESIKAANSGERDEPSRWIGLLSIAVIAGLWTVCV